MNNKEVVTKVLKKMHNGASIEELSRATELSRISVAVALAELRGQGLVELRLVGMAKVHIWKNKKEVKQ